MRSHWREHQREEFEDFFAHFRAGAFFERFVGVDQVGQLHDEGDGGVEVPARLKIMGDAAQSLVSFP